MKIYGNDFSPNSNKVRFAANAMGIDYEFHSVNLGAGEQRQEAFLKINPAGRVPALVDGDFRMFESNAIMRYMAGKTVSPLYPQDLQTRSLVDQWLDFGSIHMGAGGMGKIFFNTIVYKFTNGTKDENSLREGRQFLNQYMKFLELQLSGGAYICGEEMTLADINILAVLDPCEVVHFDLSPYPKVATWRVGLQQESFYTKVFPTYTEFVTRVLAQHA